jgi:hypothetical protein
VLDVKANVLRYLAFSLGRAPYDFVGWRFAQRDRDLKRIHDSLPDLRLQLSKRLTSDVDLPDKDAAEFINVIDAVLEKVPVPRSREDNEAVNQAKDDNSTTQRRGEKRLEEVTARLDNVKDELLWAIEVSGASVADLEGHKLSEEEKYRVARHSRTLLRDLESILGVSGNIGGAENDQQVSDQASGEEGGNRREQP